MNAERAVERDAAGESARGRCALLPGPQEHSLRLRFSGVWTLRAELPSLAELVAGLEQAGPLRLLLVDGRELDRWDSRFVVTLAQLEAWAAERGIEIRREALPEGVARLLALAAARARARPVEPTAPPGLLSRLGLALAAAAGTLGAALGFIGELALAFARLGRGRVQFEWRDLLYFVQRAGADALPIVSLISVLVGVILAFVGATQLQRLGAEIYVANLVTLGMAREMGALMAAIIMAGRTGAAYAAELGSMQAGEEVDALLTLGIPAVDYLVLPRLLALVLMMPLLALYADAIGIVGGAVSTTLLSDITLVQYYEQSLSHLSFADFGAGLGKAALFGWLVAYAGCLMGMRSGRTAADVGRATTGAVVLAIVLIVVGDALMTVVYHALDI